MMRSYNINLDIKFGGLELIDVPSLVAAAKEEWSNQTLCKVNDSVVRLGVLHGEFHWHKHDQEDEFFFVLSGRLFVDLEGKTVTLDPHQGFTVPKGRGSPHTSARANRRPHGRAGVRQADWRLGRCVSTQRAC